MFYRAWYAFIRPHTRSDMTTSIIIPELGFYYHYKHDVMGPVNNYAYEFNGVAHHTEDDCRPEDTYMAIYRPIYLDAKVYREGGLYDARPLEMWCSRVSIGEHISVPRFRLITSRKVLKKLSLIYFEMYQEIPRFLMQRL